MQNPAAVPDEEAQSDAGRTRRLADLSRRIRALEAQIDFHDTDEWIKAVTNITGLNLRQEILSDALVADDPREWESLCRAMEAECQQFERDFRERHPGSARPAPPAPAIPEATRERYEAALADPRAVFKVPTNVLIDPQFTVRQKIEVLRRWESDARQLAVAEEENMTGGEPNQLHEVLLAIMTFKPSDPDAKTSPTKQGG